MDPLTKALAEAGREPWWTRVLLAPVDQWIRRVALLLAGGALYAIGWNDGSEHIRETLACLPPAQVSRPVGRVP